MKRSILAVRKLEICSIQVSNESAFFAFSYGKVILIEVNATVIPDLFQRKIITAPIISIPLYKILFVAVVIRK
jgi:hypothetical protein